MNLRSRIDEVLWRSRLCPNPDTLDSYLRTAITTVIFSIEGFLLLVVAIIFAILAISSWGQDSLGCITLLLILGSGLLLIVLAGWISRVNKVIRFGVLRAVRIRRIIPDRGARNCYIWVENTGGDPYTPSFQAGSWSNKLVVGDQIQVIVSPTAPQLFFIPEPRLQ